MIERPRVKFCGITRREEAVAAADLGVDAVGFNFWPRSSRATDASTAREMAQALPQWVWKVGVFVDASLDEIRAVVDEVGLDIVQLHGDETPEMARAIGGRVMKALGCRSDELLAKASRWSSGVLLLVDAVAPTRRGGTGELADWASARQLATTRPIVLAGGLTAENVGDAIRAVSPYAVDVASGIESSPGVKDRRRMQAFIDAVHRSDRSVRL